MRDKYEYLNLIKELRLVIFGKRPKFLNLGLCFLLEYTRTNKYPDKHNLICKNNKNNLVPYWSREISKHFSSWEHYSGDSAYPIPSGSKKLNSSEYFRECTNLWVGEQLRYRMSLCKHLIKQLKKEL